MRASERSSQPRGASSRVSFCVLLLRDLSQYPPNEELPHSLSHYTYLLFRLLLFFGAVSENVLESRNLILLNEFMAHAGAVRNVTYTATPKEKTRSVTYTRTLELFQ